MDVHPAEAAPLVPPSKDANGDGPDPTAQANERHDGSPSRGNNCQNCFPDPNVEDPTALETAQWWAEFASIHGVYYMLERGHFKRWKALAWTAFVAAMTAFLLWALIAEFKDFGTYGVDTSTRTIVPALLEFPRVTICNANGGVDSKRQKQTGIDEPRNENELRAISQPLGEFVRHTQFNHGVYRSRAELAKIWSPAVTPLGLCYSFATDERVFAPGITAGLTAYLWLDQASYPESTKWAGVHVSVTPNREQDGPEIASSSTVVVPPGAVSFVGLSLQEFRREEDAPWAECVPEEKSVEQCRMECIMRATRDKCKCRLMGDNSADEAAYDYCTSVDEGCTTSIVDEDLEACTACSVPPCREKTYAARHSAGHVARNAIDSARVAWNATAEEISNNFVHVHVNFDSIRYDRTTETKSTTVWQLFSNLGGSFGFFMGISLISIVELFVELIGLRLLPRLWGRKQLYGLGQKKFN